MAGIGFELRRLLEREDWSGPAAAWGAAAAIGSGPWLLSSAGILSIAALTRDTVGSRATTVEFLVSVTWLMATSLVFSGCVQLFLTRYLADRMYERRGGAILPNLLGALTVITVAGGTLAAVVLACFFDRSPVYRLLMLSSFVTLSNTWVVAILVSSLKEFSWVLGAFLAGYVTAVVAAVALAGLGLEGLLGGFLLGHAVLLFLLLALVARAWPGERLVDFDVLRPGRAFASLAATGLLLNLGIWADRFLFWIDPATSTPAVGPLRFSLVYDLPVFLASLSMVPGLAVFLMRVEADFALAWQRFHDAIRDGDTLAHIEAFKDDMVAAARRGLHELLIVQGLASAVLVVVAPELLRAVGLSQHHVPLFRVAVVGFGCLVLMLAAVDLLFYLDGRHTCLGLVALFAAANVVLTLITQALGPTWYGYGFAAAALATAVIGLAALSRRLERHEYETFMLQA